MQIPGININPILNFQKKEKIEHFSPSSCANNISQPLYTDVFEKSVQNPEENVPFGVDRSLISKRKSVFSKYKVMRYDKDIIKAAKSTAKLTKTLKKALDTEYGENNYVFVSIGTSPALIGKGLELMGQDVRYVPISGIRRISPEEYSAEKIKTKIGKSYIEFLNSIGLNKDKVNNDKRKYILCDYTASGRSLKFANYVAADVLGMDKEKIVPLSLNKFLYKCLKDKGDKKETEILTRYVNHYFTYENAARYSDVPHVDYEDLPYFDLNMARIMGMSDKTERFDEALRCYL